MTTSTQLEIVTDLKPVKDTPPPAVIGQLRKLIVDAENLAEKAVGAYFKLCVFIRENQISPEQLTKELTQRKYAPSRISELKMVSYAPEMVFKRYREKVTSFRLALAEARQVNRDKQAVLPGVAAKQGKLESLGRQLQDVLELYLPVVGNGKPYAGVTWQKHCNGFLVTVKIARQRAK